MARKTTKPKTTELTPAQDAATEQIGDTGVALDETLRNQAGETITGDQEVPGLAPDAETPVASPAPEPDAPAPIHLETYINQRDETPRALASVRLDGGGLGDGTFLVDHPVPRTISYGGSMYAISREEPGVTVYHLVR